MVELTRTLGRLGPVLALGSASRPARDQKVVLPAATLPALDWSPQSTGRLARGGIRRRRSSSHEFVWGAYKPRSLLSPAGFRSGLALAGPAGLGPARASRAPCWK